MAYTTGTTHYNLPQTVGTDKRDWADTNQAFADVDAALYGAVSDVATAGDDITSLKSRMTTAEGNILTNTGDISALDTRLTTAEGSITTQAGQIADVRSDCEDMICAYNEPTATSTHAYAIGDYFIYNDVLYRAIQVIAIGDTIVPDTNCTTTNVTSDMLEYRKQLVASVTSNGTQDYKTLLGALYSSINSTDDFVIKLTTLDGTKVEYILNRSDDTGYYFTVVYTLTFLTMQTAVVAPSVDNTKFYSCTISSTTTTLQDLSDDLVSNGVTLSLYKIKR